MSAEEKVTTEATDAPEAEPPADAEPATDAPATEAAATDAAATDPAATDAAATDAATDTATEETKEPEAATEATEEPEEVKEVDLHNLELKPPADQEVFLWTDEFSKEQTKVLQSAYENIKMFDVVFVVGSEPKELKANRTVVALGSEKLHDILFEYGDQGVYSSENPKKVLWPDYGHQAIRAIIRYSYQLDPEIKADFVLNLMRTCEDLGLVKLEEACARYVGMCLNGEQFCSLFERAVLEEAEPIILGCLEWLRKTPDEHEGLIKSDLFFSWHPQVFEKFLTAKNLGVAEDDLWLAVKKWVETQKFMPVEEAMEMALPQIRFPLMSPEFFVREIANKGVLNDDDCFDVLCRMHDENAPCRFLSESRAPCGPYVVKRFGTIGGTWNFNGRSKDSLQFQTDKNCILIGVGVNIAINDNNSVCNVEVYDAATQTLVGKGDHDFNGVTAPATTEDHPSVKMDKRIKIKKESWYQIQLTQSGGQGRQCQTCRDRVEFDQAGRKITFRFQNYTTIMGGGDHNNNGTDRNSGQIPTLHFLFEY